jgi:hypothetical protein
MIPLTEASLKLYVIVLALQLMLAVLRGPMQAFLRLYLTVRT